MSRFALKPRNWVCTCGLRCGKHRDFCVPDIVEIATELDRDLGYEPRTGTELPRSPIPWSFLGTSMGNSLLNVTSNRDAAGALATVKVVR